MTDYLAHNTDTDVLEFVTLTPPEAFRPGEGGGQYNVYELGTAHAVTITGTGATPGVQSGTTYLFKKSTGELELILGTEEFDAVPAAGAGSYDVWRLGTPTAVTVAAAVAAVVSGTVLREYTANTGTEVYDLTPHGVAPFTIPATTGYTLASPNITVDTATVVGPVTVTDANSDEFVFDASGLVTASITVTGDTATVTSGDDTDPTKTISVTITGGDYDTEVISWTGTEIAALSAGQGVAELAPTTRLTTDAGSDGILNENDVLDVDRDALYIYGDLSAPTVSYNVLDASNNILGAAPYTVTAANISGAIGPLKVRATDGTNTIDSATVDLEAVSSGAPISLLDSGNTVGTTQLRDHSIALDMSGHNGVDKVVVTLGYNGNGANDFVTSATLDGNAPTQIINGTTTASTNRPWCAVLVFSGASFSASSTLAVSTSGFTRGVSAATYSAPSSATVTTLVDQPLSARSSSTLGGTVASGSSVVGVQAQFNGTSTGDTWDDATLDHSVDLNSNEWVNHASVSSFAGTTVTINPDVGGPEDMAALSAVISI